MPQPSGDTIITYTEMLYIIYRRHLTGRGSFLTACTAAQSLFSQQYISSGPSALPLSVLLCIFLMLFPLLHSLNTPTTSSSSSHDKSLKSCLCASTCTGTFDAVRASGFPLLPNIRADKRISGLLNAITASQPDNKD